ncbi:low molecular weight protein-tyrosine-phosphatase [Taibaiella koreensis]|uniref:low molecular weight protein-tyrosine-phosphatase n=1 Tax=Taibaiella koreensis TaxID=1268548 RepID=UPI001F098296|nr:low molecular weight protein-tyrosine-phosphatase [Taibaiella koreensis]
MRILMVCLGNICRSPIAEGVMRALVTRDNLDWVIDSAGTESYHIGEPPHTYSQKICQKNGVDISQQKARKFVAADLKDFDLIYVMARDVMESVKHIAGSAFDARKVILFLEESHPGSGRSVPDPWYGTEEGYSEVYDMIHDTCSVILEKYRAAAVTDLYN